MKKGVYCTVLAVVLTAAVFLLPIINHGPSFSDGSNQNVGQSSYVIADDKKDESSAPELQVPKSDETVTFIIRASGDSLMDTMLGSAYSSMSDYLLSKDSREAVDTLKKNQAVVKASIRRMIPEADFENCFTYNTVFNGFSVRAPYSILPKLQKITGVEEVILASEKSLATKEPSGVGDAAAAAENEEVSGTSPLPSDSRTGDSATSGKGTVGDKLPLSRMLETRNTDLGEGSFSGTYGSLVAVIDDGFDISHEAFSYPFGSYSSSFPEIAKHVSVNAESAVTGSVGNIVFSYDYAGRDADTLNPTSDHGTGIASVIAGFSGTEKEDYRGVAPGARLALMKVCADGRNTASDDVLLAALDDAAKLSPDIISISMGASGLNTNASVFTPVYAKLSAAGIIICAAAGNDGVLTGSADFRSTLTDYGTVSYPSSLSQVISAGAFNSGMQLSSYLSVGEENIPYTELYDGSGRGFATLESTGYIYITDTQEDFPSEEECRNKVIVLRADSEELSGIISAAGGYGAAGIILIGEARLVEAPLTDMPAAVIDRSYLSVFEEAVSGSLSYAGVAYESSENALLPTDFTSYGTSPDLTLKPDLLAAGTDIAAALSGDYGSMNGTSVSCAELTGAAAVLLDEQALISGTAARKSMLVRALLMNNAQLIRGAGSYLSPRVQGSGRLDLGAALQAKSVMYSGAVPSVSMGADSEGKFEFDLTIENLDVTDKSYALSSYLSTDSLYHEGGVFLNSLKPESLTGKAEVSFLLEGKRVSTLSLAAGESKTLSVTVALDEDVLQEYMTKAENGFYVDGYIFARESSGNRLHIPLTGFCSDLSAADMFDCTVYEDKAPVLGSGAFYATAQSGNSYPSYPLGHNMTTDSFSSYNICIGKDTVKNFTGNSSAGTSFIIPNLYLLKNAGDLTVTVTDKDKKELYSESIGSASPFTDKESQPYLNLLERFNSDGLKNLFATLPEGKYTLSVSATPIALSGTSYANSVSYDFRLDNTAPTSLYSKTYIKEGHIYLDLHAADVGGVQGFLLYTAISDGTSYKYADDLNSLIDQNYISPDCISLVNAAGDETTADYTYDITGLYHQLSRLSGFTSKDAPVHPISDMIIFRAVDYAYNISSPGEASTLSDSSIELTLTDGNGKAVKGAVISDGVTSAESDKNGKAVFENLTPDLYALSIISLPEGCSTDFRVKVVNITDNAPDFSMKIDIDREFYEEEEESLQPEAPPEQSTAVDKYIPDVGNPAVPIVFVGVLLAVCSLSLIISRIKRR